VSVLKQDADESVAARQVLNDTPRSATRWIAEALADTDRRQLGNALKAGALDLFKVQKAARKQVRLAILRRLNRITYRRLLKPHRPA